MPDHVSLWGSLIQFRRGFDQYVNLRPCRLMPGIATPLANRKPGDIDFVVVRENTEGEYSSVGGRMFEGTEREIVFQESVFTRKGVDRILQLRVRARAHSGRAKHVTSATKSNGISITMPYWDERFRAMAAQYPDVRADQFHIDILTAHFVAAARSCFDVVVGSNLFGDILSDLGPAVCGTIGIAPSANLNPERDVPVAVRAGARLGARHRRQGHRQSDRPDLVGRADARLPRPSPRRRAAIVRGDRARARGSGGAAHARPRRHARRRSSSVRRSRR